MQTVGAQWLLIHEPNASTLVALVQTASLLPMLLLALPAGALADALDRRHLLISVQLFLVAVAGALTLLTATDRMPPALLLTLTFAFGAGQALTLPAWAAVIPQLVPREQLPSSPISASSRAPSCTPRPGMLVTTFASGWAVNTSSMRCSSCCSV